MFYQKNNGPSSAKGLITVLIAVHQDPQSRVEPRWLRNHDAIRAAGLYMVYVWIIYGQSMVLVRVFNPSKEYASFWWLFPIYGNKCSIPPTSNAMKYPWYDTKMRDTISYHPTIPFNKLFRSKRGLFHSKTPFSDTPDPGKQIRLWSHQRIVNLD